LTYIITGIGTAMDYSLLPCVDHFVVTNYQSLHNKYYNTSNIIN